MNIQEITRLMEVLGTEYPKTFEVTPERMKLWQAILEPVEYHEACAALVDLLREARPFPPVVGEIYQHVNTTRRSRAKAAQIESIETKALPPPEISPEQIEKNKKMLADLSKDLAAKKAMRQ